MTFSYLVDFSIQIETRANTYTSNSQSDPCITPAADGGFFIFWQSLNQVSSTSDWDVYGQKFDKNHNKQGAEIRVNNPTAGDQSQVRAATLTSGKVVVTFHTGANSDWNIRVRIFNPDLSEYLPEFTANTDLTGFKRFPTVCSLPNDRFLLVYRDEPTSNIDVSAIAYDVNGNVIQNTFSVNVYKPNEQSMTHCGVFSDGRFIIGYASFSHPQDSGTWGVFGQLYNADFTISKAEFVLPTSTSNDQKVPYFAINRNQQVLVSFESWQGGEWNAWFVIYDSTFSNNLVQ